jgi:hypothetical protein
MSQVEDRSPSHGDGGRCITSPGRDSEGTRNACPDSFSGKSVARSPLDELMFQLFRTSVSRPAPQ